MTTHNIVVFEDENLAKLVAEEICGEPNVNVLTKENLAKVEEIFSITCLIKRPESEKIRSLKGLEFCTNLKQLHLINHAITDLGPLYDLENLETVVLRSNRIESIEVLAGKETIQTLVVGQNLIQDLSPVQSMIGLKQLYVQENPLKHNSLLFVNELPNLREFSFFGIKSAYEKETGAYRKTIRLHATKESA